MWFKNIYLLLHQRERGYHTFKKLFKIISDGGSVCGFPGLPANAIIFPADQSAFSSGELVQYECSEGWVMLGPATRVCQGGTWSGQPPLCRELKIIYKDVFFEVGRVYIPFCLNVTFKHFSEYLKFIPVGVLSIL